MENFVTVLKRYVQENGGDVSRVATNLKVSIPSVQRWLEGKNLPQERLRDPLKKFMQKTENRKAKFGIHQGGRGY